MMMSQRSLRLRLLLTSWKGLINSTPDFIVDRDSSSFSETCAQAESCDPHQQQILLFVS
jgi:hypothetical protein